MGDLDQPEVVGRDGGGQELLVAVWKPPARSDQRPGEEVVQVNDPYVGSGPPPGDELHWSHEQHPTGG